MPGLLLLNLDLSECEHRDEHVRSADEYKFLIRAQHEGGVLYDCYSVQQLDAAMLLVRQAYELAAR